MGDNLKYVLFSNICAFLLLADIHCSYFSGSSDRPALFVIPSTSIRCYCLMLPSI